MPAPAHRGDRIATTSGTLRLPNMSIVASLASASENAWHNRRKSVTRCSSVRLAMRSSALPAPMTTNTNAAATPECTAPRPTSATTVTVAPVSAAGQSDLRPTRNIDAAAPTSAPAPNIVYSHPASALLPCRTSTATTT